MQDPTIALARRNGRFIRIGTFRSKFGPVGSSTRDPAFVADDPCHSAAILSCSFADDL
jgi:hypothetical protein